MKVPFSLLSILLLLSYSSFAQAPTQDTTLANQYYQQATAHLEEERDLEAAIDWLKQANSIYESQPVSRESLRTKSLLSHCYLEKKDYKKAEILASETLKIGTKHFGETAQCLSHAYRTLTLVESARNYNKALDFAHKGLAASDKKSPLYFDHGYNIINLFDNQGNYEGIKTITSKLEKALSEQTNDNLQKYWVYVYLGKANYNELTFNLEKAILFLDKVLKSEDVRKVFTVQRIISAYNRKAYIYSKLNEFDEAFATMNKVQEIAPFSKDSPEYGAIYETIAFVHEFKDEYEEAIAYFQKAVDCFMTDSVQYKEPLCTEFGNIANAYYQLSEYDKAIAYIEKSRQFGTQDFHDFLLGKIYFHKRDFEQSAKAYHRSLLQFCTQFNSTDFMDNPPPFEEYTIEQYATFVLRRKAECFMRWGKLEQDTTLLKKGIELYENIATKFEENWVKSKGYDVSQNRNNKVLIEALTTYDYGCQELYKLSPSDELYNKIFLISEKKKAIQLIETIVPKLLPKELVEQEQRLLQNVKIIQQRLYLAQSRNEIDSLKYLEDQQFQAFQALEQHFDYLQTNYPQESNHYYSTKFATFQTIQEQLSTNTLLVSYNLQEDKGEILTISTTVKNTQTINIKGLEKNIQTLNKLVQNRFDFQTTIRNKFIDVSHELYQTLIKPIEGELAGKTRLMIIVEGQLFHLPFELLLASKEKKPYHELDFLIKKYEINYNYSATAFLHLQEKQTPQDNSLLAFAPVFKKGEEFNETTRSLDFMVDSLYSGFDKGEFAALPSTKKEATAIAKLVKANGGSTNLLLQKDATKNKLNQQLEQQPYQFIHIATHSFVNFKNPKLSAFACYAADEHTENLMYANEIQFKSINADLVVLSSCESGIGQLVAGEGLIALNRSFIYSGAKNVLFSLWKVSDQYSSELMIDFYKNYFESSSYTAALRQAKLNMLKNPESAKPKYWSAFVLMGQ